MSDFVQSVISIAVIAFPFVAMPLLWRRMKRVQQNAYRGQEKAAREQAWEEKLEDGEGLNLARKSSPNDDLIALGSKAREGRWPIDNP